MSEPNEIWVTGAAGLIGSQIVRMAPAGLQTVAWTRQKLDLTRLEDIKRQFEMRQPAGAIHCAAISTPAACAADPDLAWKVNVSATAFLSNLFRGRPFVFFSTDLVFDGSRGLYREEDAPNPLHHYGNTKAEAEARVLSDAAHLVIRTSLNAGISASGTRGFNEDLHRTWRNGKTSRLFTDEFRSPIAAAVTAEIIWKLWCARASGLYHLAGSERLSRWEIGQLLSDRWPDAQARIEAASLKDFDGPPRPPDTSLNCSKLEQKLGLRLPAFSQWLRDNPNGI